ncbi:sensor histidine kinase [Catalinimonas sp. 4WD22]|uniref:sensor histidine kinase n=1 Tax=Catalinimonas locisalis TaxID=3133978 RepID=UPI003100FC41
MKAASIIGNNKEIIIDRWTSAVRDKIPDAKTQKLPVLKNNIPNLLNALVKALESDDARNTVFKSESHGRERAHKTQYTILHIIKEYHMLKEVIFDVIDEHSNEIEIRERDGIMYAIDQAIEQACEVFYQIRTDEREKAMYKAQGLLTDLEEQGVMRDNFIASLSHDLRGPLNNTVQLVELLEEHLSTASTDKFIGQILDGIRKSTAKGNELISNLLDVNLIQAGNPIPVQPQESDLLQEVKNSIDTLKPQIKERIVIKCPHDKLIGEWDVSVLCRAIDNLISNAFKYGDNSRPINLILEQNNEHTYVSVHNEGNPIPEDQLNKLFDLYFRAEHTKIKGWGLGLTLVKGITEAHHGQLKVKSNTEHGTTFSMIIPNMVNN